MKLLMSILCLISFGAFAQVEQTPVSVNLEWLAERVHALEAGSQFVEMKKDGQTVQERVAVFSLEGSLINNYDLNELGNDLEYYNERGDKLGIGSGFHLLPYKLTLTSDGRKLFSTSLMKWKDMNSTKAAYNYCYSCLTSKGNPTGWAFFDDVDLIAFEYNDGVDNLNVESLKLDIIKLEAKFDILGAARPGHFLAVVTGGNVGWERQVIKRAGESDLSIGTLYVRNNQGDQEATAGTMLREHGIKVEKNLGFGACYRAGLEYNLPFTDKSFLNIKTLVEGGVLGSNIYNDEIYADIQAQNALIRDQNQQLVDNRAAQIEQFYIDKDVWMQANGYSDISNDSYTSITGIERPGDIVKLNSYNKAERKKGSVSYMFLSPKLSFNQRFGEKGRRIEVNVFGNIPIKHDVTMDNLSIDLTGENSRPLFGAGLKLHL